MGLGSGAALLGKFMEGPWKVPKVRFNGPSWSLDLYQCCCYTVPTTTASSSVRRQLSRGCYDYLPCMTICGSLNIRWTHTHTHTHTCLLLANNPSS